MQDGSQHFLIHADKSPAGYKGVPNYTVRVPYRFSSVIQPTFHSDHSHHELHSSMTPKFPLYLQVLIYDSQEPHWITSSRLSPTGCRSWEYQAICGRSRGEPRDWLPENVFTADESEGRGSVRKQRLVVGVCAQAKFRWYRDAAPLTEEEKKYMADLEVSVAADKNRPAATTLSDKQWRARRRRQLDDLQARRERTSGAAIPTANEVNSTPVIKGWCVCNNPTRLMEAANRWKMARMAKEIAEGTLTLVTRTAEAQRSLVPRIGVEKDEGEIDGVPMGRGTHGTGGVEREFWERDEARFTVLLSRKGKTFNHCILQVDGFVLVNRTVPEHETNERSGWSLMKSGRAAGRH